MADERKRPSAEEIVERKINMAKERGAQVLKVNSPLVSIMLHVLRQFDQAYTHLKGQLGEPGGISHIEGAEFMDEAREITVAFSGLTSRLSKKLRFKYYVPQELKEMQGSSMFPDNDVKQSPGK
jgi:hypothetical protein